MDRGVVLGVLCELGMMVVGKGEGGGRERLMDGGFVFLKKRKE